MCDLEHTYRHLYIDKNFAFSLFLFHWEVCVSYCLVLIWQVVKCLNLLHELCVTAAASAASVDRAWERMVFISEAWYGGWSKKPSSNAGVVLENYSSGYFLFRCGLQHQSSNSNLAWCFFSLLHLHCSTLFHGWRKGMNNSGIQGVLQINPHSIQKISCSRFFLERASSMEAWNTATFSVWLYLIGLSLFWLVYIQPQQAWDCFFRWKSEWKTFAGFSDKLWDLRISMKNSYGQPPCFHQVSGVVKFS